MSVNHEMPEVAGLTVAVRDAGDSLFLASHVGEGSAGDWKIVLVNNVDGSIVVRMTHPTKPSRQFIVLAREVIERCVEHCEETP